MRWRKTEPSLLMIATRSSSLKRRLPQSHGRWHHEMIAWLDVSELARTLILGRRRGRALGGFVWNLSRCTQSRLGYHDFVRPPASDDASDLRFCELMFLRPDTASLMSVSRSLLRVPSRNDRFDLQKLHQPSFTKSQFRCRRNRLCDH